MKLLVAVEYETALQIEDSHLACLEIEFSKVIQSFMAALVLLVTEVAQ